jgi:hypothetical protein
MVLHGGEMCAARDERDVCAGMGKGGAKTASNATGADYCYPHRKSSKCLSSVMAGPHYRSRLRPAEN